jgi:glycerol-3-phosphate acyltransferase PlsY
MYNLLRLVSLSALLTTYSFTTYSFLHSLLKVGNSIDELKSSVTSFLISSYLFIKSRENCLTRKLKLELVPIIRNPAIFYSSTDI